MPIDPANKASPEASFPPHSQHLSAEMFGKRKREEDEPLVPHGMIWHATPETPSEEDKQSLEKTVRYAEVIELMRRPAPLPSEKLEEKIETSKPEVPPSPLPWWRVQSEEPQVSAAAPRPILQSSAPAPIPIRPATTPAQPVQTSSNIANPEPVPQPTAHIDVARYRKAGALYITRSMAWLRTTSTHAERAMAAAFSRLRQQSSQLFHGADWKNQLNRGRISAQHAVSTRAASARRYVQQSHGALQKANRAGMARSQRLAVIVRQAVSKGAKQFPVWAKQLETKVPSANAPRVRIVFTGLPLRLRIFFARKVTEWNIKHGGKSADTRLWTSMTLAAISAIIALIIVSIVPHYAARYLPSRLASTQSTVSANAAEPAVSPVSTTPQPILKEASISVKAPVAAKKSATKAVAANAAPERKTHHGATDDYVAPDTYKYYGGNTSQ